MTDTPLDALTELHQTVQQLNDRAALSQLINAYFASLDTRAETPLDAAWARRFLTTDVEVTYPIGTHRGAETIAERLREGMTLFGATQHLSANHIIELAGDRARLRWDAIQTHTFRDPERERYVSAGYFDADAVRQPGGWRFATMKYTLTWSTGE